MKRNTLFISLLVLFSMQTIGYKVGQSSDNAFSSVSAIIPPMPFERWIFDTSLDSDFEIYLAGQLDILSEAMIQRGSILEKNFGSSSAFVAAFSQAFLFLLIDLVPAKALTFNEEDASVQVLGSWQESINIFQKQYPFKIEPNLEKFLSDWCDTKIRISIQAAQGSSKALVRFIALNLLREMATDDFFCRCFIPLFEEFYGETTTWALRGTLKNVHFMELVTNLSNSNVLIKTNAVGKTFAVTMIKSAGGLDDYLHCQIAGMLYPHSEDFLVSFANWLSSPIKSLAPQSIEVPSRPLPLPVKNSDKKSSRRNADSSLWEIFNIFTEEFEKTTIEYIQ